MTPADLARLQSEVAGLRTEMGRLRVSVDQLAGGLGAVVETLATHSSMLRALMIAAAPDEEASPLHEALLRLTTAVEGTVAGLTRIEARLASREAPHG